MSNDVPIIRLELERMRMSIATALLKHNDEINQMVQRAVDEYCTPENLMNVIDNQVKTSINSSLKDSIDRYYRYGPGAKIVKDAVSKFLPED